MGFILSHKSPFVLIGIRDQVMCFYCEGGLQNWEPNDDPWEEHTKHFPRCGYMNLMKSQPNVQHDQQYVHHSSNRNLKFHNSHSYPSESSECSGTATSIIEWQTPTTSLEVQLPIQRSKDDDKVMLQQENEILREAGLCKICADKELGVVFIPCGHLVSCRNCKASLANCPICRRIINSFMKIYYS